MNRLTRIFPKVRSYSTKPPSFFSQYLSKETIETNKIPKDGTPSTVTIQESSKFSTVKDLTMIVSILTLAYFGIDSYRLRVESEQKHKELSLKHIKSIATQQNNFNNYRKKRELQMVNERKNTQKREMKMVYHISMLRKQLIDAGLKPGE